MHEFDYIRWLRQRTPAHPRVVVGPGDDCAVLRPSTAPLLVKTDMLLENCHFTLEQAGPRRVGRKALAVNLSDIAAMGGRPVAAVVSVGLPRQGTQLAAEELYAGMRALADEFAVAIVGGDTNTWNGGLVVSVALLGDAGPQGPILRSGAKPGDWLFVTGPLGGSILGKHLDFTPRVREALELHRHADLHAMIDISDGLAKDLHHICEESRCGALLKAESLPIADAVRELAKRDGQSPLDHALSDGEDFELVFTVSAEDGVRLEREQSVSGIRLTHIGSILADGYWIEEAGIRRPLEARGYEHGLESPAR